MPGNPDATIDTSDYLPEWAQRLCSDLQTTLAHGWLGYGYLHQTPELPANVAVQVIEYLMGRGALHEPTD